MTHIRKIKAGGVNTSLDNFVGEKGVLFYDVDTGELRISDGHTPGGHLVYQDLSNEIGDIIPSLDLTYNLGSLTHQWRSLYVGTSTIYIGGIPLTMDTATNTLIVNGNPMTGGNTGTIWTNPANGCLRAELSSTGFEAFTDATHLDLQDSGQWTIGSYQYGTFIGNDEFTNTNILSLRSGDETYITTNLRENGNHQWKFGTDGKLTVPGRIATSSLEGLAISPTNSSNSNLDWNFNANGKVSVLTAPYSVSPVQSSIQFNGGTGYGQLGWDGGTGQTGIPYAESLFVASTGDLNVVGTNVHIRGGRTGVFDLGNQYQLGSGGFVLGELSGFTFIGAQFTSYYFVQSTATDYFTTLLTNDCVIDAGSYQGSLAITPVTRTSFGMATNNKYVFQIKVGRLSAIGNNIGVITYSGDFTQGLGAANFDYSVGFDSYGAYNGPPDYPAAPQFGVNDWAIVAVDRVNHKIWIKVLYNEGSDGQSDWNSDPTADPTTNTGGFELPTFGGAAIYPAVTSVNGNNYADLGWTFGADGVITLPASSTEDYSGPGIIDYTTGSSLRIGGDQTGIGFRHYNIQHAIAIGNGAQNWNHNTGSYSIVIGSGNDTGYGAKDKSIVIGSGAGYNDGAPVGESSIAIGYRANYLYGHDNSITLNATGEALDIHSSGFFVKPIRESNTNTVNTIFYNTATGELTYTTSTTYQLTVATTSTAPTLVDGQLWFDNQEGRLYIKNDGVWLDASPTQIPSPETYLDGLAIDGTVISTANVNGDAIVIDGGDNTRLTVSNNSVTIQVPGSLVRPYWAAEFGGITTAVTTSSLTVGTGAFYDSVGNVYVLGAVAYGDAGPFDADSLLLKYDTNGNLLWSRTWHDEGGNNCGAVNQAFAIDSNDRIYWLATDIGGYGCWTGYMDTDGNLGLGGTAQESLGFVGGYVSVVDIACDNSGNYYLAGRYSDGNGNDSPVVIKVDGDSGVPIWTGNIIPEDYEDLPTDGRYRAVTVNPATGDVWAIGDYTDNGSLYAMLSKWDINGTHQWTKKLVTQTRDLASAVIYNGGYVYTIVNDDGEQEAVVSKFDTDGVLIWASFLAVGALNPITDGVPGSYNTGAYDLSFDTAGNVYVTGTIPSPPAGNPQLWITKLNPTNGEMLYSRMMATNDGLSVIDGSGFGFNAGHRVGDIYEDKIVVTAFTQSDINDSTGTNASRVMVAQLPIDGSVTGTFDNINITNITSGIDSICSTGTYTVTTLVWSTGTSTAITSTSSLSVSYVTDIVGLTGETIALGSGTASGTTTTNTWTFVNNNIILPPGGDILDSNGVSVLGATTSTTANGWQLTSSTAVVSLSSTGTLTLPNGSSISDKSVAIRLEPSGASSSTQALLIYPTAVDGNHIHLTAGGGETDLYLGSDIQYVKVDHGGSIVIGAVGANTSTWTFGTDGILQMPPGNETTAGWIQWTHADDDLTNTAGIGFVDHYNIYTGLGLVAPTDTNAAKGIWFGTPTDPTDPFRPETSMVFRGDTLYLPKNGYIKSHDFDDSGYPAIGTTGTSITIQTAETTSTQNNWTFGTDGSTTFPNDTILGTGLDPNVYIETSTTATTSTWTFGTNGILTLPAATPVIKGGGTGTDVTIVASTGSNTSTWVFAADGTLTVPRAITAADGQSPTLYASSGNAAVVSNYSGNNQLFVQDDGVYVQTSANNSGTTFTSWTFGTDGNLTLPNGSKINTNSDGALDLLAGPGENGYAEIGSNNSRNWMWVDNTGSYIQTSDGNFGKQWTFAGDGSLTFPDTTVQTTAYTGPVPSLPICVINSSDKVSLPNNQVRVNFTVNNPSGSTITAIGIFVPNLETMQAADSNSTGTQDKILVGMDGNQRYAQVYATNGNGTSYSAPFLLVAAGICLLAGTMISLSDGSYKAIEDITYTDKMLSWNFDQGCYAETKAVWIKRSETGSQYNLLTFSDGTTLRTFDQHRIFNKQAGAFTYPMTDATPIGTITVNEHGQEITLVDKQVIVDTIEYYNVITDYHMNLFSDSILTSCRFNNIYPITDMKFVKDGRTLRTRDEFENIPDRFFYGLRLAEQTTDIETVEWYVNRLISFEIESQLVTE